MNIRLFYIFGLCLAFFTACELDQPPLLALAPDYGLPEFTDEQSGEQASGQIAEPAGEAAGEQSTDTQEWPTLNGLWQIEHVTTMRSELPVIMEEVETKIQATILAEVTQDKQSLWLHHKICDVHMNNTPAYNQTIIPDSFIEALPMKTRRGHLNKLDDGSETQTQFELVVEHWYDLRSISLDNPEQDTLPSEANDPRIFDQDHDGLPGLSAQLIGFPEGSVSLIQKSSDEWRARLTVNDPQTTINEVSGSITWQEEQKIIQASNDVLLIEVRRWIPEDSELHYFEMKRVDDFICPPRKEAARPQSK